MTQKWKPLIPANLVKELSDTEILNVMKLTGEDYATAKTLAENEIWGVEYWVNDLYQVAKRQLKDKDGNPIPMVQLNIRRRDGKPIFRDWRHFQWIKNQLIGDECEAVELYPAESRLSDTSNKYHLWCFTDPNYRLPFGMDGRHINEEPYSSSAGHRQRPGVSANGS